ncbi:MAG TPA: FAD-dependent oxidoreductase [Solirubrobacteraceae bacterium]|jgi:NADPH-dependent 2,4-dienoyl-CoA reductase/sulfur reductase-like enzyme|nr:FAD-dependent oxidoreductase [Solirubrobacteraceae bacterium]
MNAGGIAIVGSGPAGLAAARAYRARGGTAEVTLIGNEPYIPYRRPPLTKEFLRGELDADELAIEPPGWFDRHGIELRLGCWASAIDPDAGTIELDGETLRTEAIVLATGAEPSRPDLPGLGDPRVQTMRERRDSERLARQAGPGTHTVVLGTGFIGCELAASLALRGARVTMVGQEGAPQEQRLGRGVAERIADWLCHLGVGLTMGAEVAAVHDARIVELVGGERIEADNVVLGMGVRPRCELAAQAGLAIADGAICTDSQMRIHGRVFAVGDVAYAHNRRAGRRLRVEHWGDALGHGEVAGRVLAGEDAHWQEVPGFWSAIGAHVVKYAAWGDGYQTSRLEEHPDGAFTAWYVGDGRLVGALTHDRDEDYEHARELIAAGMGPP